MTSPVVTPSAMSPFHAGSAVTLTCKATLPHNVDTEVMGVVTWDTPHGTLNESTEIVTLSSDHLDNHTHQFYLHISSLSQ